MTNLTEKDFTISIEKVKNVGEDFGLTMPDLIFIGEDAAQAQCDKFNITMYQRMEIIAKVFNSYL